ncbi:MAG: hypothetical protein U0176_05900 [Bacteroidia bacterium]
MVIHESPNGDIWIGSYDQGAFRYDGKVIVRYDTADGLPAQRQRNPDPTSREHLPEHRQRHLQIGWKGHRHPSRGARPERVRALGFQPKRPWFKGNEGSYGP